jgi:hypothetical protein
MAVQGEQTQRFTAAQKLVASLLVAIVVLLGVIAYSVIRSDALSNEQQLECAVAADAGMPLPYPNCGDYLP